MITILGHKGSMGRRYKAILKYLKVPFNSVDLDNEDWMPSAIQQSSHVIIATPTRQHPANIKRIANIKPDIRILCEKPVTKNLWALDEMEGLDLTMQMQYAELVSPTSTGHSFYDFYNHGQDGLAWDCFQTIALAKGDVELFEDSPIWKCTINGQRLAIQDMDKAYISFTKKWLEGFRHDLEYIKDTHLKVSSYAAKYC